MSYELTDVDVFNTTRVRAGNKVFGARRSEGFLTRRTNVLNIAKPNACSRSIALDRHPIYIHISLILSHPFSPPFYPYSHHRLPPAPTDRIPFYNRASPYPNPPFPASSCQSTPSPLPPHPISSRQNGIHPLPHSFRASILSILKSAGL